MARRALPDSPGNPPPPRPKPPPPPAVVVVLPAASPQVAPPEEVAPEAAVSRLTPLMASSLDFSTMVPSSMVMALLSMPS
jgi:hypothetical protein